jgi:hypothetical protein
MTYTLFEPTIDIQIHEVILVREGGRLSEQTFLVLIETDNPDSGVHPATAATVGQESDYSLGADFIQLPFFPQARNLSIPLQLYADELTEELEAFKLTSMPFENLGFPSFGAPRRGLAFSTTEVQIADVNCKSRTTKRSGFSDVDLWIINEVVVKTLK